MVDTSLVFDLIARDKASRTFNQLGKNVDSTHHKILGFAVKGAAAMGLLTAATGAFIVKAGAPYVDTLNKVQAVTGANNKQMTKAANFLENNAGLYAKLGQTSGDAASGVVELAKSGLSLHDSLKAVYGTMVLAKAGELDVADASAVVSNALNVFHLKANKAGDVANYLANAANISSADVSDLTESLKYVSPVAAKSGVSIQQVNAILAELANAGIKGTQAGTSLRTFLLNLQAPSGQAKSALHDLNVEIFDSQGKMKALPQIIGELSGSLKGLSDKERQADLKAIFGKTGISGATQILSEGTKGLKKYTKGVEKTGAAQKLAEAKSKGLAGSFNIIIAAAKSGAQSIYRQFSPIADKVIRPLAKQFADFASGLGPKLARGTHKIKGVLDKLNIVGVGKNLAKQAQQWAKPVIAGFNAGLNQGDWSGLGKALGNGIIKAAGALGDLSSKLGSVLSKIDWVGIGIDVGKQAPSFFIGLAAGLLNFDLFGLLKGLAKHWQDVLLAVLTIAFTPGRIVGKVGELLARIPLAGKLLQWGLLAFKKFSDKAVGAAFDALKFIGRALLAGIRREIPGVGRGLSEALSLLPTRIGLMGIKVAEKGLAMIKGLGNAIAKGAEFVLGKIGQLIGKLLKPWVKANTWLLQAGKNIVEGLINGIESMAGTLIGKAQSLASKVTSPFKKVLGIFSPSKVFRGYGQNIVEGLVDGIDKGFVPLGKVMDRLGNYIKAKGQRVNDLMSARNGFASGFQSFATSAFGADFGTDKNGNPVKPTAASVLTFAKSQRHQAHMVSRDVRHLVQMGLSPALLKQLQSEGAAGIPTIQALASASKAQIQQYNALNRQTTQSLHHAGMVAGNSIYGNDIHEAKRDERLAKRIAHHLSEAMKHHPKEQLEITDANGQWVIKAIRKDQRQRGQKQTV